MTSMSSLRGFLLDDLERLDRFAQRRGSSEEQPGLGLDGYRGYVVGDRVVELAGQ